MTAVSPSTGCPSVERCALCGADAVPTAPGDQPARECAVCGWVVGDVPDAELPRPRVDVVYYLRWHDRIKIGTSSQPRRRVAAIRHEELLAFEPGDRVVERARHAQLAHLREGGEWFRADAELVAHANRLAAGGSPWEHYARWVAEALRRTVS